MRPCAPGTTACTGRLKSIGAGYPSEKKRLFLFCRSSRPRWATFLGNNKAVANGKTGYAEGGGIFLERLCFWWPDALPLTK